MKSVLKVLAALILLIVTVVVLAPRFIDIDTILAKVQTQVYQQTNRELSVQGEKSLSLFPRLHLSLNQAKLSNMAGASENAMIEIDNLTLDVNLLALISGDVVIDQLTLNKPKINLEVLANGKANWELIETKPATNTANPTKTQTKQKPNERSLPEGLDINLGEVAIYDGAISYRDAQGKLLFEDVNLSLSLPSLFEPLSVSGNVNHKNQDFRLQVDVTTLAKLIQGQDTETLLVLTSKLGNLNYYGMIKEQGSQILGEVSTVVPSVKALLKWLDNPIESKPEAFSSLTLSGDIAVANKTVDITQLNLGLDELNFTGGMTLIANTIPQINADINSGMLDLNPYIPESNIKQEKAESSTEKAESSSQQAEPIVWDDSAIDLSALNSINTDIKISSTGLKAKDIKLGANKLHLVINSGKLNLSLDEFNAYEGKGSGKVTVNAETTPYAIATNFDFKGIDANPLLTDVAGFDKVLGKGDLSWDLTTRGSSQKSFVSALAGSTSYNFSDGAFKGVNIGALIKSGRSVLKGEFDKVDLDKNYDNAEKTDFTSLNGKITFEKGVGDNELNLSSPLVRVSGDGKVDLPKTSLDLKIKGRLVNTSKGQGGDDDHAGVTIPIKVSGQFHDVKIKPDFGKAAEDKLKEKLKSKLGDLFG